MAKEKNKEKMLKIRKEIKSRKPEFLRQNYGQILSLKRKWIRPRGLHSKMRLHKKGHRKNVSPGYGSPKEVRGLSKEGLIPVLVDNLKKLAAVNAETQGIIVSSKIGLKNRTAILKEAVRRKIKVLNIKSPESYLKNVEDMLKKKKEEKLSKEELKKKKKEELKKKAEEKEKEKKLEETLSDEEKKDKEKEEKDKLLTKRS
ncbi:50S ribosomal protein L32e [Candidatus Woesearchaeota archaeon CG10_big_fil_rev_8_21_14_0_10_44_13]|nr:MAG: 50S ribosomal protein L32e [Candidatus Woesearchaeota archaeon CG10_big_fil_rev_8_21_14_0_10_44_13]